MLGYVECVTAQGAAEETARFFATVLGCEINKLEAQASPSGLMVQRAGLGETYAVMRPNGLTLPVSGSPNDRPANILVPRFFVDDIMTVYNMLDASLLVFPSEATRRLMNGVNRANLGCYYGPLVVARMPEGGPVVSFQEPNERANDRHQLAPESTWRAVLVSPRAEERSEWLRALGVRVNVISGEDEKWICFFQVESLDDAVGMAMGLHGRRVGVRNNPVPNSAILGSSLGIPFGLFGG